MHIFLHHLLNIPLQREGGGEGYDYMDYARSETGTTTSEGSRAETHDTTALGDVAKVEPRARAIGWFLGMQVSENNHVTKAVIVSILPFSWQ